MRRFFVPTKGGRLQQRTDGLEKQGAPAPQDAAPAVQPAPTGGGKGRRQMRMGASGKGMRNPTGGTGNLMQPHMTPMNQSAPGMFGAGVGQDNRPQI